MKKVITLFALLILCASSAFASDEIQYQEIEVFQSGSFSGKYTSEISLYSLDTIYNQISEAIKNKNTGSIQISSTCTIEEFKSIYEKVINDHPEYFYAKNGYLYWYSGNNVTRFEPKYYENLLSEDIQAKFDAATEKALSVIDNSMSELEKALTLHDYLVLNIAYNWDVATTGKTNNNNVYSAYGALVEGDAVCQGYALAYKCLLKFCDIDCAMVPSEAMNHVWNAVNIEGNWYHVDVTWDDPVPNLEGYCQYSNFLRSDEGIKTAGTKLHHSWSMPSDINISTNDYSGIFRNSDSVIYHYNDNYYYFSEGWDKNLYKAESLIDQNPEMIIEKLSFFNYYTALIWIDDCVYFMGEPDNSIVDGIYANNQLFCYNFVDKSLRYGESIDYTPSPSYDNFYPKNYDCIGLKLENGQIIANSRTRPSLILDTLDLTTYPSEWEVTNKTQILGTEWIDDNTLQIGFENAEDTDKTLFIALYNGEKMIDIDNITPEDIQVGLNILHYSLQNQIYDNIKIFILNNNYTPLTEYFNINKSKLDI